MWISDAVLPRVQRDRNAVITLTKAADHSTHIRVTGCATSDAALGVNSVAYGHRIAHGFGGHTLSVVSHRSRVQRSSVPQLFRVALN